MAKVKEEVKQYPLKLKESVMVKARQRAEDLDFNFNQYVSRLIKKDIQWKK